MPTRGVAHDAGLAVAVETDRGGGEPADGLVGGDAVLRFISQSRTWAQAEPVRNSRQCQYGYERAEELEQGEAVNPWRSGLARTALSGKLLTM